MKESLFAFAGREYRCIECHTAVVGTGAAGYNAALRLGDYGVSDILLVSEGRACGTSRNTGSDKQTYYKLGLSGDYPDSPAAMARDLFAGGAVDGDVAYAEAANSVASFLHLVELGVPFPTNRYGEFVGYKTDHDPRERATSVGPLTSKLMTERLEAEARRREIPLLDFHRVISVLQEGGRAVGLLALSLAPGQAGELALIRCENVIYATGGPAGIYQDTVYPIGHAGSTGVALEAGVLGKNLTEWQFGLASIKPRWNVSGTYMQVLPRFVSVGEDGEEREFLLDAIADFGEALSSVFKKGYEWPFDSRKVIGGSSYIDLLVYRETKLRGRRVFLDFRANPGGGAELPYASLAPEARDYLASAGACFGRPIDRLLHMNPPAYELYLSKGVDLKAEMLEIALSAQHNNGGLDVDLYWQTNLRHLFAVGEVAGSHGVYRPGGSALNAGQVGSMRAAKYIAAKRGEDALAEADFAAAANRSLGQHTAIISSLSSGEPGESASAALLQLRQLMSRSGGAIRRRGELSSALDEVRRLYRDFGCLRADGGLGEAYRLRDSLISAIAYLSAMLDYIEHGGASRGSALYGDASGEIPPGFSPEFAFRLDKGEGHREVQNVAFLPGGDCRVTRRPVRPLPEGGGFFENVWREFRETGGVN